MFGDPPDPEGDPQADEENEADRQTGRFAGCSVPIGKGKMLLNNAPIYGRLRLPTMTEGWEQIHTFGLEPIHFDGPGNIQRAFVSRNR